MGEETPAIPALSGPLLDPSRDFISTERYLESLERKLNKVQGKTGHEASSKDMLKSLEKVRDSQMAELMSESTVRGGQDSDQYKGSVINKNHNSVQIEEVVALVYQDQLSKSHESQQETQEQTGRDAAKT